MLALILATAGTAGLHDFDTDGYEGVARSLLAGRGFLLDGRPVFHRTPGLPLFIAACYRLAPSRVTVGVLQALADLAGVAAAGKMAARLWGDPRAGRVASWLYALSPGAVLMSQQLMSECLFNVLLLAALALWLHGIDESHAAPIMASMGVLGCAALIRPTIVYGMWTLIAAGLLARPRVTWRPLLAGAALFALVLSPWVARNHAAGAGFTLSTFRLMKTANDAANLRARIDGVDHLEAMRRLGADAGLIEADGLALKLRLKRDAVALQRFDRAAVPFVMGHLGAYVAGWARILPRALLIPHTSRIIQIVLPSQLHTFPGRAVMAAEAASLALLEAAAAVGLAILWRRRPSMRWPVLAMILLGAMFMAGSGLDLLPRYRLPLEALMVVWAGVVPAAVAAPRP